MVNGLKSSSLGMVTVMMIASAAMSSPVQAQRRPLQITEEVAMQREPRYRPDGMDFVIVNGERRFNRALYGIHGAGRVEAGDKPIFSFYLPGKGGTLQLGVISPSGDKWLHEAERIEARYNPGEMRYTITDPAIPGGALRIHLLARDDQNGLVMRVELDEGAEPFDLVFAYGAANGQRFSRGGDIGADPIDSFDLKPEQCTDQEFTILNEGFVMQSNGSRPFRMTGTMPEGSELAIASADNLQTPSALFGSMPGERVLLAGKVKLKPRRPGFLVIEERRMGDPHGVYMIEGLYDHALKARKKLTERIALDTPDSWLNTLGPAIAFAADGVWDPPAYVHGAVAWPARINGWRGAYVADPLGWHDRAQMQIRKYTDLQIIDPMDGPIEPDPEFNLARQTKNAGTRLYSSGYISSWDSKRRNHYDMNLVFIDMVFRHLMWTGNKEFAKEIWPMIVRHLAWEKRCFDADGNGLYDAFACIWASDALQYTAGDVTHSSAYNYFHNHMAARVAEWIGQDPAPYRAEAEKIRAALNEKLWLEEQGHYAEYIDFMGGIHPSPGLWTFYHSMDSQVPDAKQAFAMTRFADRHYAHIPVPNPDSAAQPYHVLATTNWHPYEWSINNVAMAEITHAALAYWQAGRADKAFHLWKGTVLDNLYYGASPGNFQQLSYLDAYRGELYRDFADTIGINARAIVEGLIGFVPDAIAGHYLLRPGFPGQWEHANFKSPNLDYRFKRAGNTDSFTIKTDLPHQLSLRAQIPARMTAVESVTVNGETVEARRNESIPGYPLLEFEGPVAGEHVIEIAWSGSPVPAPEAVTPDAFAQQPGQLTGSSIADWDFKVPAAAKFETVDLAAVFNDKVTEIFKPGKYLSPRPNAVTLQMPSQGLGEWAGGYNESAEIDDRGLRNRAGEKGTIESPQGIPLKTPGAADANNIVFTSRWDNYPGDATVPLSGKALRAYLLMAGSTNFMQTRIENGEVVATYTDGSTTRLALRNPENWWPVERNLFLDDYAFRVNAPIPPRLHLESGEFTPVTGLNMGREIHGGAATLLELPLDPARELKSLTVRTLTNEVVIGLMSVTLQRE